MARVRPGRLLALGLAALGLAACNEVSVKEVSSGESLCQEFFEACINPILTHPIFVAGRDTEVTCAAEGCHSIAGGAGGSFRIYPNANPGSDEMTANFLSAKSFSNITDPAMSKLLLEPLAGAYSTVGSHGGGNIFADPNDPNYRELYYWISHPQVLSTEACPTLDHFPDDPSRRCLGD